MRRATDTTSHVRRTVVLAVVGLVAPLLASTPATRAAAAPTGPGTVVHAAPLRHDLWIPRATSRAWRLEYVTTDSHGDRALSTGTVFVPHGKPPKGGWPV